MNAPQTNKQGFTIIEVVLVLAIAALIFLMVFIALPALQRGQRDTQRRSDVGRFMASINSFQANNKQSIPVATAGSPPAGRVNLPTFVSSYLTVDGDTFSDPQGADYSFVYGAGAAPTAGQMRYATSARCGADGAIDAVTPTEERKIAVSTGLEGGGSHCQEN